MTSLEASCVCRLQPSAPWPRVALPPVLGNRNAKASGAVTRVEYGGWSEQLRAGEDAGAGAALPSLAALRL